MAGNVRRCSPRSPARTNKSSLLATDSYRDVYQLVDDWAGALSEDERAKLFGGNAARFYRLR